MDFHYKNITKNDIRNDHDWTNALIIVTANDARNAINLIKLKLFAKHYNRIIYGMVFCLSELNCTFIKIMFQ